MRIDCCYDSISSYKMLKDNYTLWKIVMYWYVLIDFSLTVTAATLIFISRHGSAISSAKEGKSGFIYNWVKS